MGAQKIVRLAAELKKQKLPCRCGEPLKKHTTFHVGGPAAVFCEPRDTAQLLRILELCKKLDIRHYLLGKGSNTLFSDAGFDGAVICLAKPMGRITVNPDGGIAAGAGAPLAELCRAAQQAGRAGLEFAYGIPGSVGGAIYMNAGAYGSEMKNALCEVTFLGDNFKLHTLPAAELKFGYRTSIFERTGWCILEAKFCLAPGDPAEILSLMKDLMARRKEKQPLDLPSAGSTFKRPVGEYAGHLIEQCGLRGFAVGGAAVSEKHCGFVVNTGNATCADIVALTDQVIRIVKEKTGYTLEREIRVVE
jgi:UDP-N-acetylmuramate dehydrogenase